MWTSSQRSDGLVRDTSRSVVEVLLVTLGVLALSLLAVSPAWGAPSEEPRCETGTFEVLRDRAKKLSVVTGVRISGLGDICDGVAIGIQFMGNEPGDPNLASTVYATSYSDEDPCTGDETGIAGTSQGGVVDVLLCDGHPTAGHVPGQDFTGMRLISGDGVEVLGIVEERTPDTAGAPGDGGPTARTGADAFRSALTGALLVLLGVVMVRFRARRGAVLT